MKKIITTLALTFLTLTTFGQKTGPLIGTVSLLQPTCNGYTNGEISVTPSGGFTPYTYLWSNGDTTQTISNLTSGNYSVTVTDAVGQQMNGVFTLTEPSPIIVEGMSTNTAINTSNGTIDITNIYNTVGNYTWVWSSNNNQVMDQSSLDQSNLKVGTYKIYVTDENGCQGLGYFEVKGFVKPLNKPGFMTNGTSNNTSAIQLDNNNTTRSNRMESEIKVYPNPSNGDVTINSEKNINEIRIVNTMTGEEVYTKNSTLSELQINNLKTGSYVIYISTEEGTKIENLNVL